MAGVSFSSSLLVDRLYYQSVQQCSIEEDFVSGGAIMKSNRTISIWEVTSLVITKYLKSSFREFNCKYCREFASVEGLCRYDKTILAKFNTTFTNFWLNYFHTFLFEFVQFYYFTSKCLFVNKNHIVMNYKIAF